MRMIPERYNVVCGAISSIMDYVNHGVPPGDFITAVLSNDLKEAFGRADSFNSANMKLIVEFCYNYIPAGCWGSPERVKAWLEFKRQQREMEKLAK